MVVRLESPFRLPAVPLSRGNPGQIVHSTAKQYSFYSAAWNADAV